MLKPQMAGIFFMSSNADSKRIGIYVDVQNIYYTTREIYNGQFNYRELWREVSQLGTIIIANAYATERHSDDQHRFQSALRHIGFEVKLRPFIQRADGSAKGDWDVGLAIDVLDDSETLDTIVLLSGDGDFDLLLSKVKSKYGVRTEVFGVPELTANSLIKAADTYHPITRRLII
jgi:uncharacterized LabA/DUF88 family protein